MDNLVDKIFLDHSFERYVSKDYIKIYKNDDNDYYMISHYCENDISDFFDSQKTNDIIEEYKNLSKSDPPISSNTSLIILFKTNDIKTSYNRWKNMIMRIEEDEYFFRKYIIIYSEPSLVNLVQEPIDDLFEIVKKENNLELFQENNFFSEEYYVCMQLIIKIPFLILPIKETDYQPLEKEIKQKLQENNLAETSHAVEKLLEVVDDNEKFYEMLKSEMIDEVDSNHFSQNLLNLFEDGANEN
ncbi:ABC-three component system middle component 1 [Salinicoccus roseus]|jgi:hypothetical protein|uniref:ABC-three component system middle component 1 n=1 Tax=Salinicoccus roseus TaxID=45670 RepID=UPI003568C0D2